MRRIVALLPASLLLATSLVALTPSPASAATIKITTTADEFNVDAGCSLREAIVAANTDTAVGGCPAGSGADVIKLPAGTYTLSIPPDGTPDDGVDGDLDIVADVTIRGAGARKTIIDGDQIDRVFHALGGANATVAISEVTIRDGQTADAFGGGALLNVGNDVTFRKVTLDSNQALDGGAVANSGATAVLTVVESTLAGNQATDAVGDGGAIWNLNAATVNIRNSTLSGNSAVQAGGGIETSGTSTVSLTNATITNNTAGGGGGISHAGGVVDVKGSIVAGNQDTSLPLDPDCSGTVNSMGHNLIGNLSAGCAFAPMGSDLTDMDPKLKPLANNGGPTDTHALRPGSPARNEIPKGSAPNRDQRGAPRAGKADIGAYEFLKCRGVVVNRVGTGGKDVLVGTAARDGFLGLGGADTIKAKGGNDGACAGKGRDVLIGGGGNDKLDGDQGPDTLRGGGGNDNLLGDVGNDKLFGGAANDKLNGGAGLDLCRQGGGVGPVTNCET